MEKYRHLLTEIPLKECTQEGRTAYHESGHAIIGRFYRHTISKITIVPDQIEGAWGSVTASGVDRDEFMQRNFSGIIAEYLYSGLYNAEGAQYDYDRINEEVVWIDYEKQENYLKEMFIQARDLLSDKITWNQVERLAKLILEVKEMNEAQLKIRMPELFDPSELW